MHNRPWAISGQDKFYSFSLVWMKVCYQSRGTSSSQCHFTNKNGNEFHLLVVLTQLNWWEKQYGWSVARHLNDDPDFGWNLEQNQSFMAAAACWCICLFSAAKSSLCREWDHGIEVKKQTLPPPSEFFSLHLWEDKIFHYYDVSAGE